MMRPLIITLDNQTQPSIPKTTFTCKVYDMDLANEFKVFVNGAEIYSSIRNCRLDNQWKTLCFDITEYVTLGANTLTIKNPTSGVCYVKDVVVTVGNTQVVKDCHIYKLQQNQKCLYFSVSSTTTPTLPKTTFTCKVYDMDLANEFNLLVNGQKVYSSTSNYRLDNQWKTLYIDITTYLQSGNNTIIVKNPTTGVCYVKNVMVTVGSSEELNLYQTFKLQMNQKNFCFNI